MMMKMKKKNDSTMHNNIKNSTNIIHAMTHHPTTQRYSQMGGYLFCGNVIDETRRRKIGMIFVSSPNF